MGLDVSKIEKSEFYSSYTIKSPIKGFIASINVTIGQNIDSQQNIAEIIDAQSFQLQLFIFENNINKIRNGQPVMFYLNGDKLEKYKATINSVGKTIMSDSKSIECYAEIANLNKVNIVGNQFVEGDVYTNIDSVLSVPETAVIVSDKDSYILVLEKEIDGIYFFKKMKINTARKDNNYIELTDQLPSNKLLIDGVYNIQIE